MTNGDEQQLTLSSAEVAQLLEMAERTVQKYARELGGKKPLNGRAYRFTIAGICAGAAALKLNIPNNLKARCEDTE